MTTNPRPSRARRAAAGSSALLCTLVLLGACGSTADHAATQESDSSTPADSTVPDTTVPDSTVPDTTVPDTTIPDTAPDTTIPDTAPDTTTPDTAPSVPDTDPADPTPPTSTPRPDRSDRATVLAVATADIVRIDPTVDQGPWRSVSIVDRLGVPDETSQIDFPVTSVPLTAGEKAMIEASLPGVLVTWVSDPSGVVDEMLAELPAPSVVGLVMLAEPVLDGDRAEVAVGIVCGALCGHGGTDVIERGADGTWSVTGSTGGGWIS